MITIANYHLQRRALTATTHYLADQYQRAAERLEGFAGRAYGALERLADTLYQPFNQRPRLAMAPAATLPIGGAAPAYVPPTLLYRKGAAASAKKEHHSRSNGKPHIKRRDAQSSAEKADAAAKSQRIKEHLRGGNLTKKEMKELQRRGELAIAPKAKKKRPSYNGSPQFF